MPHTKVELDVNLDGRLVDTAGEGFGLVVHGSSRCWGRYLADLLSLRTFEKQKPANYLIKFYDLAQSRDFFCDSTKPISIYALAIFLDHLVASSKQLPWVG